MVSKTIFASLVIFKLMDARESGLISGGIEASGGSLPSSLGGSVAALLARFFSSIAITVLRNSCSAIGLEGSMATAR